MESLQKKVIDYEYDYYESAWIRVFRKQTYSSRSTITLKWILDHRKGDLKGISLFCSVYVVMSLSSVLTDCCYHYLVVIVINNHTTFSGIEWII